VKHAPSTLPSSSRLYALRGAPDDKVATFLQRQWQRRRLGAVRNIASRTSTVVLEWVQLSQISLRPRHRRPAGCSRATKPQGFWSGSEVGKPSRAGPKASSFRWSADPRRPRSQHRGGFSHARLTLKSPGRQKLEPLNFPDHGTTTLVVIFRWMDQ
jgi:hypothetical protein